MSFQYFVIIGGQRSGSTYLYRLLDEHPEIEMIKPIVPEPKTFLKTFDRESYNELLRSLIHKNTKCVGEKSTSYYENPDIAKKIINFNSATKALMILRNPVERAISNYYFSYNNGLETRTLEEVFIENKPEPYLGKSISVSPFNYIERGCYSKFLLNYQNIFKDNFKAVVLEELTTDIKEVCKIYSFLNVNPKFNPRGFLDIINSTKRNVKEANQIEEIKRILNKTFESEIKALERILNKDLSLWKKI